MVLVEMFKLGYIVTEMTARFSPPRDEYFTVFWSRCYWLPCVVHKFMSIVHPPNQSPEPMRGGAVSSASRLDVVWSRMAQLRMLGVSSVFDFMNIFGFKFEVKPKFGSPDYGVANGGFAYIYVCADTPKQAVDKALQEVRDSGYRYIRTEKSGDAVVTPDTTPEQKALMDKAELHGVSSVFVLTKEKTGSN